MQAEAKVEMKKIRSSRNLDLNLSLPRARAPTEMFSLGLPCLKVRNDVQRPARLAVRIGITFNNALAVRLLSLQQGQPWAACDREEWGLSIQFLACYSSSPSRG